MSRYQPMATAPKDGREVWINTFAGEVRAYYVDCAWLRQPFIVPHGALIMLGDPEATDCWRPVGDPFGDIELSLALGWRPT